MTSDVLARPRDVAFLDLLAPVAHVQDELDARLAAVARSGRFLLGPETEAFESAWAATTGRAEAVAVASGHDALELALRGLGIGPGDEVVVPAMTFVATWSAVVFAGATPVGVDVDADGMLDARLLHAAITSRTAAVVPVALYGRRVPDAVVDVARAARCTVVVDAAQAHGVPVDPRVDAEAWSFYPGKNLGGLGDGGAVSTDDPRLAEAVRRLRSYGAQRKYDHVTLGRNSRPSELECAALSVKLSHLDGWTRRRHEIAEQYRSGLASAREHGLELPSPGAPDDHAWHLFTVHHERRDALASALAERGVATGIHYPQPPSAAPAMEPWAVDAPVARSIAATTLSLPMGPHLDDADVAHVVAAVTDAVRTLAGGPAR